MTIADIPILTDEQRQFFDNNGFLVVEDALPPDMVERLIETCDRVDAKIRKEQGLGAHDRSQKRNVLLEDPDAFLPLVDWRKTVPLAWQLLGWNLHLITSHLIVLPPAAPGTERKNLTNGFHRDGGTSASELAEPHPRMFLKIAYFLTDLTQSDAGALQVVPGSNRLIGRLPMLNGSNLPHGAIELNVKPGTAVFFENRCYHGVGQNFSDITRKSLYFGYGYRWVRPMDYVQYPQELLDRCTPVQRQMLGYVSYDLGAYLPKDEDVPVRALLKELEATRTAS
jgi:ectoine hydroxylase-related dioxygenase (phytanoyl-CoA dioxygenase family)